MAERFGSIGGDRWTCHNAGRNRRSIASVGSSASFVCGLRPHGRPPPVATAIIVPRTGRDGKYFFVARRRAEVFRSRPSIAGMAWFGARTRTFRRFRQCDSGPTRTKRTIMGTEGSGQRRFCRHGGACLRRAMFSTRNAPPESVAPPPRCLSAWSGVQATSPPLPICTSSAAADRVPKKHRCTRTSRDGGGGREKDTPSGSEHGSTVASTVVAGGAGQIAQTNDCDNPAETAPGTSPSAKDPTAVSASRE